MTAVLFELVVIDDWWDRAACRGMPRELFFTEYRTQYPCATVQRICASCPVRAECLEHALAKPEHYGVWGGVTEYQRRQLKRARVRTYCPGCGSAQIERGAVEVCLACALSWDTTLVGPR